MSYMDESPEKFNIFRVYQENHLEDLTMKPVTIVSEKEISFATVVVPQYTSGDKAVEDLSICPELENTAIVDAAETEISLISDANEFIQEQNYPAAEHLLGRKLTVEEMSRGSILFAGKKTIADQLEEELDREDLKAKMRIARGAAPLSIVIPSVAAAAPLTPVAAALTTPTTPTTPLTPILPNYRYMYMGYLSTYDSLTIYSKIQALDILKAMKTDYPSLTNPGGSLHKVNSGSKKALINQALAAADRDIVGFRRLHSAIPAMIAPVMIAPIPAFVPPVPVPSAKPIVVVASSSSSSVGPSKAPPKPPAKPAASVRASSTSGPATRVPIAAPAAPALITAPTKASTVNFVINSNDGKGGFAFDPRVSYTRADCREIIKQMGTQHSWLTVMGEPLNGVDMSASANRDVMNAVLVAANQAIVNHKTTGTGLFTRAVSKDYIPFGKFLLNEKKLRSKREFSLVYPKSGQKPEFIKNAVVSRQLHECINSYLAGEPMDNSDLTDEEKEWMKYVWDKALGVKPKTGALRIATKKVPSKKELLTRLKIAIGEIEAGNDNPLLIVEMKDMIKRLELRGWLSDVEIYKLKQFIALSE